jgi:putative peptide zinc metalloprotease protein
MLLLVLFVPWRHSILAPAVISHTNAQGIYAAHPSVVKGISLREGQSVAAGEVLATLSSPELEHQLQQITVEEQTLRWQVEQQPFDDQLHQAGPALRKRWEAAREALAGVRAQIEQLTLRAPFGGRIVDMNPDLRRGIWLKGGEYLFGVIGDTGIKGEAFVDEADLLRVKDGAKATFVGDLPELHAHHCHVSGIDRVNVATLEELYVASVYGGPIASRKSSGGEVLPRESVFRVRFDGCAPANDVTREIPGRVLLQGSADSIFVSVSRKLVAIIKKEITA